MGVFILFIKFRQVPNVFTFKTHKIMIKQLNN